MKSPRSAVLLSLVALLPIYGCGSKVDNATSEAAARSLVKAMIAGDSKAIDSLSKSDASGWSTSRVLEAANNLKMVGTDISDYEISDLGKNAFLVKNKKTGQPVIALLFIFADGRYYFIRGDDKGESSGQLNAN